MTVSRIEVEAPNGTAIGSKFTVVGPGGERTPLTNVRAATIHLEAGKPISAELDTILIPVRATSSTGVVRVSCTFCDHSHTHAVGEPS